MKTLVIHPKDTTTDMLGKAYEGKDWTIITYNPTHKDLKEAIKSHDRIVMLGHGTKHGLFGFGRFVIDSSLVYLLREKYIVCVWCNADEFVKKYELKGFYTGMIISEVEEANYHSVEFSTGDITISNDIFSNALAKAIDADDILETMLTEYPDKGNNPIITYNAIRIYHS